MVLEQVEQTEDPGAAEEAQLAQEQQMASAAKTVWDRIIQGVKNNTNLFDRMDDDLDLYDLVQWQPEDEEPIDIEDAYTTNAPKVLADKIISFISQTNLVFRIDSDKAGNQQEKVNDNTEELAIGMLANVDRRRRRMGEPTIKNALAWYTVVRGRYAAARAMLRKRENGETFEDILPLDPRYLLIWQGDEELLGGAFRILLTRSAISEKYPRSAITFKNPSLTDQSVEEVWEYYTRERNPNHDPESQNPFEKHPFIYTAATLIEEQWAQQPFNISTLQFPIVIAPVTARPTIAPQDLSTINSTTGLTMDKGTSEQFGESIFAANRAIWNTYNRKQSYKLKMLALAANPPKKWSSLDGTDDAEEGATDKDADIMLSTANQEDLEFMQMPDVNRAFLSFDQDINIDMVAGSIPPQAFGLLDKPLSSVALRFLGLNLDQHVSPRLDAVAACVEGCLEVLIGQFETGAFAPLSVSGRRNDRQRFGNREIKGQEIQGHSPVEVEMRLALPQDDNLVWQRAAMAAQPTASGEPLMDLEYIREEILRVQFPNLATKRNREVLAQQASPVVQLFKLMEAALEDGDMISAAALFDQLRIATLTSQVQGSMQLFQLSQIAAGIPPITAINQESVGQFTQQAQGNAEFMNPANGATPAVEFTGIGNQPSPEAGANTTATRQRRDTGLVDAQGNPLFSQ